MADYTPRQVIELVARVRKRVAEDQQMAGEGLDVVALPLADVEALLRAADTAESRLIAGLRTALDESGTSQAAAARVLGISTKHMSQMLIGKAPVSIPMAERIAGACGRTLEIRIVALSSEEEGCG